MKRVILIALVAGIVMTLCGCEGDGYKNQRIEIIRTNWRFDTILIPLQPGEVFSKDAYSIQKTEIGYDIVIHVEKEDGNAQAD